MIPDTLITFIVEAQKWLYDGMTAGLKATPGAPGSAAMMGTAFVFGCIHALMPGHGKTLLFSYHLGQPSRIAEGAVSAILLAVTHVGLAAFLVLIGVKAVSTSFGDVGRSQVLEIASASVVMLIGGFLAFRAFYSHAHDEPDGGVQGGARPNGRSLAVAAGFIPCPLTTFILFYAVAHGRIPAGIAAVVAMLGGIAVTLIIFAISAVLLRERFGQLLAQTTLARGRLGFAVEILSALLITAIGAISLMRAVLGT